MRIAFHHGSDPGQGYWPLVRAHLAARVPVARAALVSAQDAAGTPTDVVNRARALARSLDDAEAARATLAHAAHRWRSGPWLLPLAEALACDLGEQRAALEVLAQAGSRATSPEDRSRRALALWRVGAREEARQELDALARDPRWVLESDNAEHVLGEMLEPEEAVRHLAPVKAANLEPDAAVRLALAWRFAAEDEARARDTRAPPPPPPGGRRAPPAPRPRTSI